MTNILNISHRKVGGIWWLKLGRFCFAFSITREYRSLRAQPASTPLALDWQSKVSATTVELHNEQN